MGSWWPKTLTMAAGLAGFEDAIHNLSLNLVVGNRLVNHGTIS